MMDDDAATRAKRYRERAEALRTTVLAISHPDNRKLLLDAADLYDQLADSLEQNAGTPTNPN